MSSDLRDLWSSAGGQVPIDWEFKTIEELLEHSKAISVGVMYPGDHSDGGIPLIKVADVKNGLVVAKPEFCISEKVDEEYKRTRLNGTELLITLVGNPGDCVVVTDEMSGWNAARAIAVVRLKDIELRAWLRYVLLSKPAKHLIETRLNTTVQKTLNLKDIRELGIPVPPLSIRKKITSVIDGIEWKIQLNRQINQTLEQMAQAIFQSWFVDFEPVKAKIAARENWLARQAAQSDAHDDAPQFSSPVCYAHEFADAATPAPATQTDLETFMNRAAMCTISGKTDADLDAMPAADYQRLYHTANLFPDELVESELGEIPKGWEIGTLADLCALNSSSWTTKNLPDQVDYVDLANTKNGEISAVQVCMGDDIPSRARRILNIGDTIVGTVRPGNRSFAFISRAGLTGSTGFAVLTPNRNELREVVCLLATSDSNIERLTHLADGGAYPAVRPDVVVSGDCVIPPASIHDSFHHAVQAIFDWIGKSKAENESLVSVRDTLLPKLLSGELDISALTDLADHAAEPGAAHV